MDISELVKTHRKTAEWLGGNIIHVCVSSFTPNQFIDLASSIPSSPSSLNVGSHLDMEIAEDMSRTFDAVAFYFMHDLDKVRNGSFSSVDDLSRAIEKYEPEDISTHSPIVFRNLELPFDSVKRDEKLIKQFGPLYDALMTKWSNNIARVDKMSYGYLLGSVDNKDDVYRAGISWACIVSDDPLKNALALPIVVGKFDHHAEYTRRLAVMLCGFAAERDNNDSLAGRIDSLEGQRDELRTELRGVYDKLRVVNDREGKHLRAIADLTSERDSLKISVDQLNGADFSSLQKELDAARHEASENAELANSYAADLETERGKRAELEQKLKNLSAVVVPAKEQARNYRLSNGSGLRVFAAPEFIERYDKLRAYSDSNLEVPFADAIDATVSQICERIGVNGRSAERSEFDRMWNADVYVFKKSSSAPGMRVLFTTDWQSWIRIYDVTTPEDHKDKVKTSSGRYHAVCEGRVEYSSDTSTHVEVRDSLREVLKQ